MAPNLPQVSANGHFQSTHNSSSGVFNKCTGPNPERGLNPVNNLSRAHSVHESHDYAPKPHHQFEGQKRSARSTSFDYIPNESFKNEMADNRKGCSQNQNGYLFNDHPAISTAVDNDTYTEQNELDPDTLQVFKKYCAENFKDAK